MPMSSTSMPSLSGGGEGVGVGALVAADLPEEPGCVAVTNLGSLVGEARVHGLRLVGLPGDRVRTRGDRGHRCPDRIGIGRIGAAHIGWICCCGEDDPLQAHLRDELGQHESTKARPRLAAGASAASFTIGGLVPFLGMLATSQGPGSS